MMQDFKRNMKREYAKIVIVLQAYALISTGVRIICSNQVITSPPKCMLWEFATDVATSYDVRSRKGDFLVGGNGRQAINYLSENVP